MLLVPITADSAQVHVMLFRSTPLHQGLSVSPVKCEVLAAKRPASKERSLDMYPLLPKINYSERDWTPVRWLSSCRFAQEKRHIRCLSSFCQIRWNHTANQVPSDGSTRGCCIMLHRSSHFTIQGLISQLTEIFQPMLHSQISSPGLSRLTQFVPPLPGQATSNDRRIWNSTPLVYFGTTMMGHPSFRIPWGINQGLWCHMAGSEREEMRQGSELRIRSFRTLMATVKALAFTLRGMKSHWWFGSLLLL